MGMAFAGRVVSGLGQGASFTQLEWARIQFVRKLGIDPFPGTLNLILDAPADLRVWSEIKATTGILIAATEAGSCDARCYPVRIEDRIPGAIVLPEVHDYRADRVEVIASLSLRETLTIADGDRLEIRVNTPLRVRAVLFDVDGTLVDSIEAYQRVAELAAAPHGISISRQVVRRALNTNQPFWELALSTDLPDRTALIASLKEEAARRWQDALRKYGRTFPDLREMLEALRRRGARLGIVTGARSSSLMLLDETGLARYFDAIVTGQEVRKRKPDPEGLVRCVDMLGIAPSEAVYVGDTPVDIQASRAAGMGSVAVLSGAGDTALLSAAGPDWIIYSLGELGATLDLESSHA
jgi:2-phosphoglycolate phosphatase